MKQTNSGGTSGTIDDRDFEPPTYLMAMVLAWTFVAGGAGLSLAGAYLLILGPDPRPAADVAGNLSLSVAALTSAGFSFAIGAILLLLRRITINTHPLTQLRHAQLMRAADRIRTVDR